MSEQTPDFGSEMAASERLHLNLQNLSALDWSTIGFVKVKFIQKKLLLVLSVFGLAIIYFYWVASPVEVENLPQIADENGDNRSKASGKLETYKASQPLPDKIPAATIPALVATYETKIPETIVRANKTRIEIELANGELARQNKVPFDIHYSFEIVAGRCSSRFNFPPKYKPSETQFMRLVENGTTLNTEQARNSYKYVAGFYQSVCDSLGAVTVRKLSELLSHRRNARKLAQESSKPLEMPTLIKIVNESTSISEVSYAIQNMAPLLIVKPASYQVLWQQAFMHAGTAMPSRADRVNSSTVELVGQVFYCKNRPDECMPGTYFTVMSCESFYVCAPGLDVNAYLATQHSPDRLLAANQIADALIEMRRLRTSDRRIN